MSKIKIVDTNQNIKSIEGKLIKVENKDEYVIELGETLEPKIDNNFKLVYKKFTDVNKFNRGECLFFIKVNNSIFKIYFDKILNSDYFNIKIKLFSKNKKNKVIIKDTIKSDSIPFTENKLYEYTYNNFYKLMDYISK